MMGCSELRVNRRDNERSVVVMVMVMEDEDSTCWAGRLRVSNLVQARAPATAVSCVQSIPGEYEQYLGKW